MTLLYEDAIEKLRYQFHKTRLTKDMWVSSDIINGILYGKKDNTVKNELS